jgi:putative ABC transport system permease protein
LNRPEQLGTFSISRYVAWRDETRSFESVAAFNGIACGVRTLGFEQNRVPPERIIGQTVSPSFFRTLGVQPMIGRTFTDAEDIVDQVAPVMLISHRTWERRFGGDPAIIGKLVTLDRTPTTVIGVLPPTFDFFGERIEFIAPLCLTRAQVESRVGGNSVVARLKAGVSIADAQRELDALAAELATRDPDRHRGFGIRVESISRAQARSLDAIGQPSGDYGTSLMILQGAVAFVLLIACANVAGLLMARTAARRNEVSLRLALGAPRGRIVRQLITETLPLAVLGATAGTALAWGGLDLVVAAAPANLPRLEQISLDLRVLGITALVTLFTNLFFALAPALQASNVAVVPALRDSSRSTTDSVHRQRLRSGLVAGQVALAVVLLAGAGLMIRSFIRVLHTDLGADPTNVLTFDFRLPPREVFKQVGMYRGSGLFEVSPVAAQTIDRVVERLQHVPGVSIAAAGNSSLLSGQAITLPFTIEGGSMVTTGTPGDTLPTADYQALTPHFFSVMKIPLRRGRDFDPADTADTPFVAIVNETLAQQFFANEDPIGRSLRFDYLPNEPAREIVGVVGDTLAGRFQSQSMPAIYVPHVQQTSQFVGPLVYLRTGLTFTLRTEGDPLRLIPSVQRAVAEIDPATPVANPRTVEQILDDQVKYLRLYMLLLGAFGIAASLLAAIGIYGVIAYAVTQRTREFGIRMAMGARAVDVLLMVLGYALRVIGIGLAVGLVLALSVSQTLRSLLFEVTSTDPATYVVVSLVLLIVAAIACLVPARRATLVSPTVALRAE